MLSSLVWGAILGAGYDAVHGIANLVAQRVWWRGLEDLVYWTVCAVVLFAMIREENGGTIRWYVLAGSVAGASVYHLVVRPVIHRLLKPLWISARKVIHFVENLLKKWKESVTLICKVGK